jgi:multidrug efflux system outer membrane protein
LWEKVMVSKRTAAPALLLILAGCVAGPDHKPPEMPLPAKFTEGGTKPTSDVAPSKWWVAFGDSRLNSLVDQGVGENLTILQALERINSAEASVTVAGAGSLPSLLANGHYTSSGQMGNLRTEHGTQQTTGADITASWLLDLFGQFRRARESAEAQVDAAYATVDVSRLAFLQDLVSTYIDVRYYQARISISQDNLKSRRETLELTKFQLEAGAASRLDVVQAEGLVNSTLAEIPSLEISYRQSLHHIATLLDVPSAQIIAALHQTGNHQPVFRGSVNSGVPADLVRNRPDIRKAERDLASASAQIGVAEAQLWPSITLSGAISPSYIHTSVAHGGFTTWSFGPAITLPILDGGLLRANVKIAESNTREQYIVWKQTVVTGVQQVEDALSAVRRDSQIVSALKASVSSYVEALALSTASYKDGASSLLDVLDAQRSVSTAQAALAQAVQQSARDYVSLNVAIGAGYVAATPTQQKQATVAVAKTN